MTIEQAKNIDMVDYLARLGHQPTKISEPHYWYLSPLRPDERTPSFKINRTINKWKDWGSGNSGNIIDFGIQYHQCTVKEFLQKLDANTLTARPTVPHLASPVDGEIRIIQVKPITSIPLIHYVRQRGIPIDIAERYLKEINYQLKGKNYFALGFKNDAGGYELRNKYIKASSAPKMSTFIDNKAKQLGVFEGFFNFLTHRAMHKDEPKNTTNYLILNSLSFFDRNIPRMSAHDRVLLYLDNDKSGDKYTKLALTTDCQKFSDERKLYFPYQDLNDWILNIGGHQKQQHQRQHRSP
ncbi:toprim domain-containing protein [Chitinophaga pendula]|uniref:toprim domain-containing protein n=1 Tax=Chitinophaga TaxID=79328 RepID=UPI000BAFB418|nr:MULTISPECIES: toprim domain-containing protein [Chitinophaga]ASZ13743.1 DNA primase [Chitinophaga sp. MD30]UCJ08636.1 toprim domain-containing protein [Chitinophaga pendula]